MAGITLEQAEAKLVTWMAANETIASGQEYEIDTGNGRRRLKRADLAMVQQQIEFWDAKVKSLTPAAGGGRRRQRYVVPE